MPAVFLGVARKALGTAVPVSNNWTEIEVTQGSDGTIQVVAQKGDVSVSDGEGTSTVPQGQETTVDDPKEKTSRNETIRRVPRRKIFLPRLWTLITCPFTNLTGNSVVEQPHPALSEPGNGGAEIDVRTF